MNDRRASPPDRGSTLVATLLLVAVVLAGSALVVDGGRAMVARRHASNVAEGAARAAVATGSADGDLDRGTAGRAALDHARRSGVAVEDVAVVVGADSVTVTVTERRRTVFLVLGGVSTTTVHATGTARLVYDP